MDLVELVGTAATMGQAVRCLGVLGRAAIVALSREALSFLPYTELINKEAEVIGVSDHLTSKLPPDRSRVAGVSTFRLGSVNLCHPMRYPLQAAATLVCAISLSDALAQEPDLERLLQKLPPPEKLVRTEIAPGIRRNDQILQDPLVRQMSDALTKKKGSRALDLARKLSAQYPASPLGHFVRGSLALQLRHFSEASGALRQAVVLEPRFALAHLALGVAEMAQSHFAAALPPLRRSTELQPKLPTGWIVQSVCCMRLGQAEESVRAARRATTLAPKSAIAWRQLANAENAAGHRKEAALAKEKADRITPYLDPRIPPPREALPAVRRAALLQPNNAAAQFQLGYTLADAGRLEEAVVALRKTVILDAKHAGAWQKLGVVSEKLGRQREADAAFAKAEQLMPVLPP